MLESDEVVLKRLTSSKEIKKKPEMKLKRRNTDIMSLNIKQSKHASSIERDCSPSPDHSPTRPNSRLLKKLDLSVSQYSDMFEE